MGGVKEEEGRKIEEVGGIMEDKEKIGGGLGVNLQSFVR